MIALGATTVVVGVAMVTGGVDTSVDGVAMTTAMVQSASPLYVVNWTEFAPDWSLA
jgi:hypothetical protein